MYACWYVSYYLVEAISREMVYGAVYAHTTEEHPSYWAKDVINWKNNYCRGNNLDPEKYDIEICEIMQANQNN